MVAEGRLPILVVRRMADLVKCTANSEDKATRRRNATALFNLVCLHMNTIRASHPQLANIIYQKLLEFKSIGDQRGGISRDIYARFEYLVPENLRGEHNGFNDDEGESEGEDEGGSEDEGESEDDLG